MLKLKPLLTEEGEEKSAAALAGKTLKATVSLLKKLGSDADFIDALNKGVEDGEVKDEAAKISSAAIPCHQMFPTQAEIGFGNSIDDLVMDEFGAIKSAFTSPVLMPSPGKKVPILCARVGGDIMILDGHHRWSLCYMINRNAKMQCDIIETEGGENVEDVLKTMQIAITAKGEKPPITKIFKGQNLMTTPTAEVVEYVKTNLGGEKQGKEGPKETADEVALFSQYTNGALDSAEKIAAEVGLAHEKIIKNVGEFPRDGHMPQAGETTDQDIVNKALEKGEVDYMPPFAVKDGYKAKGKMLKEHFQKIAKIKR